MKTSKIEYAKICPNCDLTLYPRISPAIIVAIIREGKILLARRAGSQMYSVIAGYVEAGETLEQTVYRESQEEVGLRVKNIRYFSSQPWPFSYALMLAFTAEYDCGDIVPDGKEIEEARWFAPNELPEIIPAPLSVARALIEWFKTTYKI
jgi:NAD+ diphosphatase